MEKLDEYKMFFEYINKLTDRRQIATTIYISVNSAITVAIAFLLKGAPLIEWVQKLALLFLFLLGILVCDLWRRSILQYGTLLGWWFARLRELENEMSESDKFISREYQELYMEGKAENQTGFTRYEIRLTWFFMTVYSVFGLGVLIVLILGLI